MPFQVVFSQKAIPAGIIQAIDAGDDTVAVCDINFTLTAKIIGDPQGHTVSWQQISGTPVTFTTPTDQLSITYSQTTFDDKAFRFYVDRGTAFEIYDDVIVYGSPTDNVTMSFGGTPKHINFNSTESVKGDSNNLRLVTNFPLGNYDSKSEYNLYSVDNAAIYWNTPNTEHTILGYIVKEMDITTGVWNDVASLPPSSNYFQNIKSNHRYQISTLYLYKNSHVGQKGSNIIWIDGNLKPKPFVSLAESKTHLFTGSATHIEELDYNVEKLIIITHSPPSDSIRHSFITSSQYLEQYDYDVEKLSIITHFPPFDKKIGTPASSDARYLQNYDYDVTVQTGGQVGG